MTYFVLEIRPMTYIEAMADDKKQENKVQKVCFTLNNWTPAEYEAILEHGRNKCKFMVVGKEVGTNGTPHLQGYVNLVKRTRFTALKKFLPRAHFEVAKGTDEQNLTYCTKQDKEAFVSGVPQRAGQRSDLKKPVKAILEGTPIDRVALAYPIEYVKYHRGFDRLAAHTLKSRSIDDPPMTIWLWGKAGTGKTRFAYEQLPHEQVYMKDGTRWWDGYTQQQCILIDDFDGEWPFRDFLRVLDRYPYQGQTKGGYVQINSPIIIVTCEYPPTRFWHDNELAQVERRFNHIVHME